MGDRCVWWWIHLCSRRRCRLGGRRKVRRRGREGLRNGLLIPGMMFLQLMIHKSRLTCISCILCRSHCSRYRFYTRFRYPNVKKKTILLPEYRHNFHQSSFSVESSGFLFPGGRFLLNPFLDTFSRSSVTGTGFPVFSSFIHTSNSSFLSGTPKLHFFFSSPPDLAESSINLHTSLPLSSGDKLI